MVRPATKAKPEETDTKRRTSELPVKTINSLYFVHQFPVGSTSRPAPRYPSLLLFKPPSLTLSKQLHAIKTPGMMLEWSKSLAMQARKLIEGQRLQSKPSIPYICSTATLWLFESFWSIMKRTHFHLQLRCSASSYTKTVCTRLLCLETHSSPTPTGISVTQKNIMFILGML